MSTQLRFSPRPNRAHEISWRDFDREAFETARREGRLILLSISAVWCHWCHVMDETTYSDQEVIDLIESGFIAVRVDTDQRPDVNSRYNMGGWPTTVILTPDGSILTGGTYIPAPRMKYLLREALTAVSRGAVELTSDWGPDSHVADTDYDDDYGDGYDDDSYDDDDYADDTFHSPDQVESPQLDVDDGELWDTYEWIRDDLVDSYDAYFGGFGTQPKFPMVGALRLCAHDYVLTQNREMEKILTHSLESMVRGGIYDQVEGGFFRYSTTRDWQIPHFEKMLEDNSLLLDLLVDAYKLTRTETFVRAALDTLRYLEVRLLQQRPPSFCGSQDADEAYYSMDASGRRKMKTPFIDQNVYSAWNALAVQAILNVWTVTGDESQLNLALSVADTLRSELYDPQVGVYHYLDSSIGKKRSPLTLDDQIRFVDMALRIYSVTGNSKWRNDAAHLVNLILNRYVGEHGLLRDISPDSAQMRPLLAERYDFHENARAASALSTASAMLERDDLREAARRILSGLKQSVHSHGGMAAEFALAVQDVLRPWARVTVAGCFSEADGMRAKEFLRVLHSGVRPQLAVIPLDVDADRAAIEDLGIRVDETPVAVACVGRKCLMPQMDPEVLLAQLDQIDRKRPGTKGHEYEDYKQSRQEIPNPDLGDFQ